MLAKRETTMSLISLPTDILITLPSYLHSIDDLYSLISTCRRLRQACQDEKIRLKPDLRARDDKQPLQPYPHLLIAGTARQVGDWAVQSVANRSRFHDAVSRGITGLYQLCVDIARMSLQDMRELHKVRQSVLAPLSACISKGYACKNPPTGCHDNGRTEQDNHLLCLLNLWIYSDLFRSTITASYKQLDVPAQLTPRIRLDYIKHCIPDQSLAEEPGSSVDNTRNECLPVEEHNGLRYQQNYLLMMLQGKRCPSDFIAGCISPTTQRGRWTAASAHAASVVNFSGLLSLRCILSAKSEDYTDAAAWAEVRILFEEVQHCYADGGYKRSFKDESSRPWRGLEEDILMSWTETISAWRIDQVDYGPSD